MNIDVQPIVDWNEPGNSELTGRASDQLSKGEIPYIRIPRFATTEECDAWVDSAVKPGFGPYRGVEPIINRIGNTVFEYNGISRHAYFAKSVAPRRIQKRMYEASCGPLERFIALFEQRARRHVGVARIGDQLAWNLNLRVSHRQRAAPQFRTSVKSFRRRDERRGAQRRRSRRRRCGRRRVRAGRQ
ncbi:hypothetical protein [Burkholderia paludis]|uniref:hypothetical protein n=1 Tax=Burkholderia paludis TaxID=1506587 RepID=UPI0012698FDD|nr:hypothetical protein [Burkholderia paludis]